MEQLTAERLAAKLDAGESFTLIDTRSEDDYEAWHVPGAENVPYKPQKGIDDEGWERIDALVDGGPVVAICGKGLSSTAFGFELQEAGYDDVSVVKGGMEDWSRLYEVASIETSEELVLLQVQRRAKGCLGYVIGDPETGEAAVVDATRQTDVFKIAAEEAGLTIERVLDTHVHADHVSGGPTLAAALDVPYHLPDSAEERGVEHEYEPVADGETIAVGEREVRAMHTPGHTSEMTSYHVDGEALLTGDTLFVDGVGRTELQFGDSGAEEGAELLYESLRSMLELPDETTILPGHVDVSSDGRYGTGRPGEAISARLGELREELDLLGLDREAFVDRLAENEPEKPANYETVISINTGEREVEESEATELEMGPNNCAA
jgi:glyoxylase-like metal-dependent hydrolase (beta-lactamase superfamily II)/rhodanese-related sulfurtransferase